MRIKLDSAHTALGKVLGSGIQLFTPDTSVIKKSHWNLMIIFNSATVPEGLLWHSGIPVGSGIEMNDMVHQGTQSNAEISGK